MKKDKDTCKNCGQDTLLIKSRVKSTKFECHFCDIFCYDKFKRLNEKVDARIASAD